MFNSFLAKLTGRDHNYENVSSVEEYFPPSPLLDLPENIWLKIFLFCTTYSPAPSSSSSSGSISITIPSYLPEEEMKPEEKKLEEMEPENKGKHEEKKVSTRLPQRQLPSLSILSVISRVSKYWKELSESNLIWFDLANAHWPSVKLNANVRSWKTFFQRRWRASKQLKPLETHPIENCGYEWVFKCPLLMENLPETEDPTRLFCDVCTRHVVVCSSIEDIEYNVAQDHCVSFDPDIVRSPIYDQRKDLKDRLEKRRKRKERRERHQKKLQNQAQDEEGICQEGKEEEEEEDVFEEEEDYGEDEDDEELDAVEERRRKIEELYDERHDKMPRNIRGLWVIKIGVTGDDDRMTLNFARTLFNSCKNQCPDSKFQVTSDGMVVEFDTFHITVHILPAKASDFQDPRVLEFRAAQPSMLVHCYNTKLRKSYNRALKNVQKFRQVAYGFCFLSVLLVGFTPSDAFTSSPSSSSSSNSSSSVDYSLPSPLSVDSLGVIERLLNSEVKDQEAQEWLTKNLSRRWIRKLYLRFEQSLFEEETTRDKAEEELFKLLSSCLTELIRRRAVAAGGCLLI